MKFDYSKLRGRIVEKCENLQSFAKEIGMSSALLSQKLNNHLFFRQVEIEKASKILDISPNEIGCYFFTLKVQGD